MHIIPPRWQGEGWGLTADSTIIFAARHAWLPITLYSDGHFIIIWNSYPIAPMVTVLYYNMRVRNILIRADDARACDLSLWNYLTPSASSYFTTSAHNLQASDYCKPNRTWSIVLLITHWKPNVTRTYVGYSWTSHLYRYYVRIIMKSIHENYEVTLQ